MAITKKNMEFVEEYLSNGYNLTLAYQKVYGCSYESANKSVCAMFRKQEVQDYLHKRQKERLDERSINAERVLDKLAEIAFAQKGDDYYNSGAQLKALDLLQKQLGVQTQKIDATVEETIITVSLLDEEEE